MSTLTASLQTFPKNPNETRQERAKRIVETSDRIQKAQQHAKEAILGIVNETTYKTTIQAQDFRNGYEEGLNDRFTLSASELIEIISNLKKVTQDDPNYHYCQGILKGLTDQL